MTKPLLAGLLLLSLVVGCATSKETEYRGSTWFDRLPPCQVDSSGSNFLTGRACEGSTTYYVLDHTIWQFQEYDRNGNSQGLWYSQWFGAEEGWAFSGVGAEIAALIGEHAFDYLDAPVLRVTQTDTPFAFSPTLINEALPNKDRLVEAIKKVIYS